MKTSNKISIPKKVKIGGATFKVCKNNGELEEYELENKMELTPLAIIDYEEGKIVLGHYLEDGKELNLETRLSNLFHEVLHGIDFVFCGEVFEEEQIELLQHHLYQVLKDNNLNLYEKDIKYFNKIKILGYTFYIDYDNPCNSWEVDIYTKKIFTKKYTNPYMKKMVLISSILSAIFAINNVLEVDSDVSKSLAHGLVHFLQDSKFEKLIKGNGRNK